MAIYSGPVKPGTNQQYFTATGKSTPSSQVGYGAIQTPYSPPKIQAVLGASDTNTGSYNIPSTATNSNQSLQSGIQNIQQAQGAGNDQIEADYNQSMSMLDNAQSGLQGQASQAGGVIDTGAADTTNQINNEQTTAQQGVNANVQTAQTQAKSATQQARDLFRQTQQNNSAQLSALGISSSSVTDALAEKLGVETARRIASVGDSLDQVQQNATNELGRIKTYYQGQLTTLQQHVADQKAQIQNSLITGLNQINAARGQAASDKSTARANLLTQVQNQIGALTQQQQQFQQSLDQWAQQKTAALTPIAQDPNYVQNLINTANTFNKQFSPTGFSFTPSVNVNANGTMTGQISSSKTPTDQFGNPINQASGQVTSNNGVAQPDFNKYPNDGFTY